MLHDITRRLAQLDPLLPHLPRALALLDPMRKWRPANAIPKRKATPLHVGEAPSDSGQVGT